FSVSALSADADRHVGVGHPLDQVLHLGPPLGVAEEHLVFRLRLELLAQRRHFASELVLPQRVGQRHLEIGFVERLVDEVGSAQLHRNRSDRKSTRLNSSHGSISYAVFWLKKKNNTPR